MKKYGKEVKIFRSDSETVLVDGDMGRYLKEKQFLFMSNQLPRHTTRTSLNDT